MYNHALVLTLALLAASAPAPQPQPQLQLQPPGKAPLRLHPDGSFKIAVFSDQHYGENEDSFGIPQDINSTLLTRHVLATEAPDLAVLNGDLITGENTFRQNASSYLDVLVAPLAEANVPWASTYGNHDSKYNLSRAAILAREQHYAQSYTQHGPPGTDGVSNYVVPLYHAAASFAPLERPAALLYFLDSRGGRAGDPSNGDNIPNYVSASTAAWFRGATLAARARWPGAPVPSLLFVHIPVNAFLDLQGSRTANVGGSHFPGLNADVPLDQEGSSAVGGGVYTGQDVPFMKAMLETEGLHSIYSGHDHGDSWCGLWQDSSEPHSPSLNRGTTFAGNGRPFLCFCKPSGFGGYGTWNRGVRQLALTFDSAGAMHVTTYVRMQPGADHAPIITRVALNSSYGSDEYPTDDGGYHPY